MKPKHINDGACAKCDELFDKYPGFHPGLRAWFKSVQKAHHDAHISCAGRGKKDQAHCYSVGSSRAKWGESSHNFNCALDFFRLTQQGLSYDPTWFRDVIGLYVKLNNLLPNKDFSIKWYGAPGSRFFELPHCEVDGWRALGRVLVE